jgi:hypothetical protein
MFVLPLICPSSPLPAWVQPAQQESMVHGLPWAPVDVPSGNKAHMCSGPKELHTPDRHSCKVTQTAFPNLQHKCPASHLDAAQVLNIRAMTFGWCVLFGASAAATMHCTSPLPHRTGHAWWLECTAGISECPCCMGSCHPIPAENMHQPTQS